MFTKVYVKISGNDASRIYHSLLLQKPIRKQHWKPKNLKRKDSVSKNQLRVTYSLEDLEKAGWKQASKKKLMAITGISFFIFFFSRQSNNSWLQTLRPLPSSVCVTHLKVARSQQGLVDVATSVKKKIQFSMWHWYFLKVCLGKLSKTF